MSEDILVTLIPIIIIGLIGLAAGGIAGYLLAGAMNPPGDQARRGKHLAELARFWSDKRNGQLILEIGGKMYMTINQLPPKQRAQLERLSVELEAWLGLARPERQDERLAAAAGVSAAAGIAAAATSAAQPPVSPPIAATLKTPLQTPVATPPVVQPVQPPLPPTVRVEAPLPTPPETEIRKPSMRLPDILASALNPEKKEPLPPTLSIAAQVDEIVQERLPNSPFGERVIRLLEVPGRGMVVIVDQAQYESVNDVADEQVRQFLRECVAEWERRSAGRG